MPHMYCHDFVLDALCSIIVQHMPLWIKKAAEETYSPGQKFRTFYVMTFLWPPNFEHGWIWKLQAKMSRGCRFLLFWHHSYKVNLNVRNFWQALYNVYLCNRQSPGSYKQFIHLFILNYVQSFSGLSLFNCIIYIGMALYFDQNIFLYFLEWFTMNSHILTVESNEFWKWVRIIELLHFRFLFPFCPLNWNCPKIQ